jgi:hypothetical protein
MLARGRLYGSTVGRSGARHGECLEARLEGKTGRAISKLDRALALTRYRISRMNKAIFGHSSASGNATALSKLSRPDILALQASNITHDLTTLLSLPKMIPA